MHDIKTITTKLIKKHSTNNPFKIAESKKIFLLYEPLGKILGYYSTYKRVKFIHINYSLDDCTQRFVCAHELGHAILHPKANTPFLKNNTLFSIDKIEVEANTFAVELLLPDKEIYEYKDTSLSIKEVCSIYGIPQDLAHLKTIEEPKKFLTL